MKQILVIFALFLMPLGLRAATYTVTSTADSYPSIISGQLRWAINQANSNPGLDIIAFNIATIAPHTIQLAGPLSVTSQITMDGSTQPANGYAGVEPKIRIRGNSTMTALTLGGTQTGFSFPWSTVANITFLQSKTLLHINQLSRNAITNCVFYDAETCLSLQTSDDNEIMGCYFGTDHSLSMTLSANSDNAVFLRTSSNNDIGSTTPGQPNFFYNMRNINRTLELIEGSFGNEVYGNIFRNNARNLHLSLDPELGNCDGTGFCLLPPVFTGVTSGSNFILTGTTTSLASASNGLVQVYLTDDEGIDAIQLLGTAVVTTAGNWTMTLSGLPANFKLIATSWDPSHTSTEFSPPYPRRVPCDDCVNSFSPQAGKYVVSGWVKESGYSPTSTTYTNSKIRVILNGSTNIDCSPSGRIIDGWQRFEEVVTIPGGTTSVGIQLRSTSGISYFDDIRFSPLDGSMKSYVYDPVTLRLVAELDERNYATTYEYDEEGKLIRVKKETEKGFMTIKEDRDHLKKTP